MFPHIDLKLSLKPKLIIKFFFVVMIFKACYSMFKRPEAKSSVFDSQLLISVENDGLLDVHVFSSELKARDENPSLSCTQYSHFIIP